MEFNKKYDRSEFINFLQHKFLPEDFIAETTYVDITRQTKYIRSVTKLGTCESLDLVVYEIRHDSLHDARVGLSKEAFRFLADEWESKALVLFVPGDSDANYRFSLITIELNETEEGKFQKIYSNPRRYSYYLGEGIACHTPNNYLKKLDKDKKTVVRVKDEKDLVERFSVEVLNKEFFNGYKAQYTKFLKTIADTKQHRDYVKKLLGRLVFLQFLQKKGWMGVPATNDKWEGGDKNYLRNLMDKYKGNNRILSDVLEPLFFKTLNEKRAGDIADSKLGDNIKIPYLNGGLFDKDRIDELDIDFEYSYFDELINFFSQYNFTIDENDPDDAEIGVDPEMLGHIFENLLEDNKDKGAFYTPKEIVQYMCNESVVQYLKTHTDAQLHAALENLIRNRQVDAELQNKETANAIYELLRAVKVCDPAIGSGAFPMGVLNVLFNTRQILYGFRRDMKPFLPEEVKRDIIQNNIFGVDIEQGAVDIARLRFWLTLVVDSEEPQPLPNLDYKIVCGNSLLSRYRLDEPIKNVFVEYNKKNKENKMSFAKYQQMVKDYLETSDHTKKDEFRKTIEEIKKVFKTHITGKEQKEITDIEYEINCINAPKLLPDYQQTKEEKAKLKDLEKELADKKAKKQDILDNKLYENAFEWRFEFPQLLNDEGDFIGFDIVIGNPPYLRVQGIRDTNSLFAEELVKKYQSATGSFDLYAIFAERGLEIIKQNGIVNYIMPDKWTNAAFGKGLRKVVSDRKAANKIISFGAYQVFNASTYTALQWFRPNSEHLEYYQLDRNLETNRELDIYLKTLKNNNAAITDNEKLKKESWVLTVGDTSDILRKLESHPRRIADIFDRIFCGLQTSKDDVYFLYNCIENTKNVIGYSKQLERNIEIEKGLVKPLLKGEDVHRYDDIKTDRYVIFPYKLIEGKAILYTEKELSDTFPLGYSYLKDCEDILRGREKGRLMNDEYWFRYIYPKNLVLFDHEKLVAPDISMGGNFAYDICGKFYQTTTIYGYIKKAEVSESYKFWMALLNSRLCWWFLTNTGTTLANGFFRFKPDYIKPFPVPEFKRTNKGEMLVIKLTDFLLYLYDKNNDDILTHTTNKRLATHIEEIIDMIFYELYFEQHMKDNQIDVISDLNNYGWSNMSDAATIESFYKWYQQSENMVRQKIMLLDTRSRNFIYLIHRNATL